MNPLTQANQQDLLIQIGNNIRNYRLAKNWTQLDLAVVTENHKTQIARIERGQQNLGICTLEKIAYALGVNLNDLIPNNRTQVSN